MHYDDVRSPRVISFLLFVGLLFVIGATVPAACNHGGGLNPADAGATGGATGGSPVDAAGTGGAGGPASDGSSPDQAAGGHGGDSGGADAGGVATGGSGPVGTGGAGTGGRVAASGGAGGGAVIDPVDGGAAGAPVDGATTDQSVTDGGAGGAGGGTSPADGGGNDSMFVCGPCTISWVCGGAQGTPYTYITLVPEEGGCYLSGWTGHKMLAPDGTITENGVSIAKAQKFGPQVGIYNPDGSQWLYCGGNLPCN